MNVIDLTHTIKPGMPVYPGTEPPVFENPVSIEKDGFLEKRITLFSHTGTHMDAPAHIFEAGMNLDQFPASHFTGSAFIVDISHLPETIIETKDLLPYREKFDTHDFVLLYSGWDQYWGQAAYFSGYPVLDKNAASWISQFELKGLGIDMISVDAIDSSALPIHHLLLKDNFILIENLKNLGMLRDREVTFTCLPLKIGQADGAPARAVAALS